MTRFDRIMPPVMLLALLQAAGPVRPSDEPCGYDPNAITVCAHRKQASPRLPSLPDVPEEDSFLPRANFRLFGDTHLSFDTSQATLGSATSHRVMATIKIPLGGRR